jgi:hypothetical protein
MASGRRNITRILCFSLLLTTGFLIFAGSPSTRVSGSQDSLLRPARQFLRRQDQPTWTPFPTATIDPAAFDMKTATLYKTPNDDLEILLPKPWEALPSSQPGNYQFVYGQGTANATNLSIAVGEPTALYESIMGITNEVDSPEAALDAFKKSAKQLAFGNVRPVSAGILSGAGLVITIPGESYFTDAQAELWILELENSQIALIIMQGPKHLWPRAKAALTKMMDSLVINPQYVPTTTPTSTQHPLRLTQAALQQMIDSLTPAPTSRATRTPQS